MALHDYQCASCRLTLRDQYRSIAVRASATAPTCPSGCGPMTWIPQVGHMDAGSVKSASFEAFDTFDTFGKPTRVTNFRDLRRIEAESERAYRNGEGQLLRWRDASMDRSNRDQSSIAKQLDRPMDMQDQPRVEATSSMVKSGRHPDAAERDQIPDDTPFSLEDALPAGGADSHEDV